MASSSSLPLSSTSPSFPGIWEHDVFPSFHGADVRKGFLSHILKEFKRKAIDMFIDNNIKRGEFIGPELKRAIRGSKIAVVLLSKNYASSTWCLDELVEIMKRDFGQIVITVFYKVDPTHVRKQTEGFGKVFKKTCEGKDKDKIETWRKSLEDVANITGYHISDRDDEASMIEKIAVNISNRLSDLTPSRDFETCIGLGNHMKWIKPFLCLDSNEVRMIGIWGPPGIGKTTIARFLFNELSRNGRFQNSALMEDIKRSYIYPRICSDEYKAKLQLQKEMMSKMIDQSNIVVGHLGVAPQRLKNMKVLLVLDDVDRSAQVDALAKNVQWFGPGSRIIITTEDRRLLKAVEVNHIYEVGFPSTDEALQMFCMYAFQKKTSEDGFDELAREITYLVGQLPLGLEVMGSYFRGLGKNKKQWSMEISRLRTNLNGDIESILKFSYDALCEEDKDLFLEISCFFNHDIRKDVKRYLAPRFNDLKQRLHGLDEKSLLSSDYYITVHILLAQLAKKIVREELACESGKHQFLNDYKDVCQMLTGKKITEICYEDKLKVVCKSGHPTIIYWLDFPFTCLGFTNNLKFLVELYLRRSKLEKLWDGTILLPNLKILDLIKSHQLKELPNLSMTTNLEELVIEECSSLVSLPQLPESVLYINANYCKSLEKLDCSFGNSLKWIDFIKCFNLNKEARHLIIHTSTSHGVILPGKEVPACFTYRASGNKVTVRLNQKHLPTSTKFKACILVVYTGEYKYGFGEIVKSMSVDYSITFEQENVITTRTTYYGSTTYFATEHLYIFDVEAKEVTSTELDFTFNVTIYNMDWDYNSDWEIKECGVLPIHGASCYERLGQQRDMQKAWNNSLFCERGTLICGHTIIPYSASDVISD